MLLIPFSLLFHLSEPDISNEKPVLPPVATFSIVGYDCRNRCAWESLCNPNFSLSVRLCRGQKQALVRLRRNLGQTRLMGLNGLKLLKSGLSAEQTLKRPRSGRSGAVPPDRSVSWTRKARSLTIQAMNATSGLAQFQVNITLHKATFSPVKRSSRGWEKRLRKQKVNWQTN